MNLQEQIRKVIKEEINLPKKIRAQIDKIGVLNTARVVGGLKRLINILGKEYFTKEIKILTIQEIVGEGDERYITLMDMNENPIVLGDENGELSQIEMIYSTDIVIFYYGGYKYSEDMGESYIKYEQLPKDILDDIFDMVVKYGIDNYML